MNKIAEIGIIGGSGLYNIDGLSEKKWVSVKTPFGKPSDRYLTGNLLGKKIAFLPRHGCKHDVLPTDVNYCANIYGFKSLGVERIVCLSAVGSLRENIRPLDIVVVEQFIDRTNQARKTTFFGEGVVAHISFADPVCPIMRKVACEVLSDMKVRFHKTGTYLNMEGPAFSTKAEANLYRSWGADIIGMTNMPEARLCREAEICYASIAFVTDYDCWRESGEIVTAKMVLDNLSKNVSVAKKLIKEIIPKLPGKRTCVCQESLKNAIFTNSKHIPAKTKEKLRIIAGKYIF